MINPESFRALTPAESELAAKVEQDLDAKIAKSDGTATVCYDQHFGPLYLLLMLASRYDAKGWDVSVWEEKRNHYLRVTHRALKLPAEVQTE